LTGGTGGTPALPVGGGALLFEKEISGGVCENNVVSSHSFIDYYIFLNGRKVGMYIRDDVDNGEEESYYYLYDGQGNVVEVANKVGDLPWYLYTYTTYGNTSSVESNEAEDDLLGLYKSYDEGPFGYKTGVRHYDPETGVFISPDPFKGYMGDPPSQHPYMYCHGNPIAYWDPSGYADLYIFCHPTHALVVVRDKNRWSAHSMTDDGVKVNCNFDFTTIGKVLKSQASGKKNEEIAVFKISKPSISYEEMNNTIKKASKKYKNNTAQDTTCYYYAAAMTKIYLKQIELDTEAAPGVFRGNHLGMQLYDIAEQSPKLLEIINELKPSEWDKKPSGWKK
jgi:RHS repeat-associated protein